MRLILATSLVLGACGSDPPAGPDASCDPAVRQTRDRVDDSAEPQVHVIYTVPRDGVDRGLDTSGVLATSVAAWSTWLTAQTGGPGLRLDTCGGLLDITYVALSQTDAELLARGAYVRDEIESALQDAGHLEANKLYAVYHDGGSTWACGGGAWPPTLPGRVAAMYLRGTPPGATPCDQNPFAPDEDTPGYLEYAMLHEIVHTLGLVAECAPNHTRSGHTSEDPSDLMYAGDQPWTPSQLDVGRNDYHGHGGACADLARSALMSPTPAELWLPAGW
jgi:hypothetical protein